MHLHAQIYQCHLTSTETLTLINISDLLHDLIPEILKIDKVSESLQEVDISLIPESIRSVLCCNGKRNCTFRSYVLSDSILKLTLTLSFMVNDKCCESFTNTMSLMNLNDRLKAIYRDSLNRHLSN